MTVRERRHSSATSLSVIRAFAAVAVFALVGAFGLARADAPDAADPHAHHRQMMQQQSAQSIRRSEIEYTLPDVRLVRQDGKAVSLKDAIGDDRPVLVNFIYTTCTTICPLSSQVFAQFQSKLGAAKAKVHLVSFSIDPEQDTPARLVEYAQKFHAGPNWEHFTGTVEASVAVQRSFDAYRGDKMNHGPLTLMRAAHGKQWVRFDGFASADELLAEYQDLIARH
ncbi:MAG: SCO family protein [Pseudomonadota bacterium]